MNKTAGILMLCVFAGAGPGPARAATWDSDWSLDLPVSIHSAGEARGGVDATPDPATTPLSASIREGFRTAATKGLLAAMHPALRARRAERVANAAYPGAFTRSDDPARSGHRSVMQ